MMRITALLIAAACALAGPPGSAGAEPINVVASFSILADMVAEVGGAHVAVSPLVGPDGDAHVFTPSPADARRLAQADLVVVNGLGFEGWVERLIESSGYAGPVAIASAGIEPRQAEEAHEHEEAEPGGTDHAGPNPAGAESHGSPDPHAWQSLANAATYAENIAAALCGAAPAHCGEFERNAARYLGELQGLDASIRAALAAIPPERRRVITSHDSFGYFGDAYGITFIAPQGVSTDADASAADAARLIKQIRATGARAVFVENIADPRLIEQLARESGATVGGALYSDALSAPEGPAGTYLSMMRHNAELMIAAMRGD